MHLRKLAPKTPYTFALYSVPKGTPRCREGASGGTQETAFPPKTKKTNKRGNLNAKQQSKTFKTNRKKRYFVLVSDGDQVVACAKLDAKRHRGHGHQGQAEAPPRSRSTAHKPSRSTTKPERGHGAASKHAAGAARRRKERPRPSR